jgi:hypothetical protein
MEFMLTLAVISPPLLCSRKNIVQAWGRSHYIISEKCYVSIMLQKVLKSKRKKMKNEKKYDGKKRKVRKKWKNREREREKSEKNEKEIK